ncbi:hypothetical protein OG210_33095 (plasmid) [Streptomyces sp. NBC_00466]|uniref:hypothetical protein n=1 Tax=Streptomyces sp. NBC_00466 TaxID=2903655 RepID=UPI002F91998D
MQDIISRYQDGESARALADAHGMSERTVFRILCRHHIPRRGSHKELPLSNQEIARRYLEERQEIQQIAQELGVSRHTIAARLTEAGVNRTVGQRPLDLPDELITERRRAGESAQKIAADLGVSHTTVLKHSKAL